ncbi:Trihydroxynaphthalene reductase [Coemansia sp. RSA 486]|nr:Trihydroxynaphthalene reductase [Coemansia sp. RSA 486]KAJ2227552.1 Trihydroxynaphthalene reductase [Coemansia sp. RSA 485]KAJ2602613.1 Trihydroxynaphthalene reductase [Coemansia sp. RSA 1721]KAJ2639751.1 Trihydroxynaphthalene reductase [Coemansia sp. RSA 1286]KAJ2707625.1 Trihydroxynaphthalene reductase [Coemansia sp. IMI 203386]
MGINYAINVPATSANIGPGFDVMGLSLSLYLTVNAHVEPEAQPSPSTCNITISYEGENSSGLPLDPRANLITRTALYVLECNGLKQFPHPTTVRVNNRIPLGRGLGSSGAAVVAGVILADAVGSLGLTQQRMLDYCLMIEHHPDNVAAALVGGFVASYLIDVDRSGNIPASEADEAEVLRREREQKAAAADENVKLPPENIGHFLRLGCSPKIRAVTIIPQFELATSKARAALPGSYKTHDVVFNLQRLAVLTTALGRETPDPWLIYRAMEDKVHQPYRMHLIPGLPEILATFNPDNTPGLLGICLSGAGPTILALAVDNFDEIAAKIRSVFDRQPNGGVATEYKLLDIVSEGSTCEKTSN